MMKTEATNFGFEILVTFLLPGFLAVLAVVVAHGISKYQLLEIIAWAESAQFIASFVLLAAVALAGAIVASIQAVLETFVLDYVAPCHLKISRGVFEEEWNKYISDLSNNRNSYISRVVLFFQFETRLGVAAVLLGLATVCRWPSWYGVFVLISGLVFYCIGTMHHIELAKFRHRHYGAPNNAHKGDLGGATRPPAP